MEFPEVEVFPGVYVTDYRKKATNAAISSDSALYKPTSEEYKRELAEKGMIDPIYLNSERHRFERAISRLQDTNKELAEEADEELVSAISENEIVISKYQGFITVIDEMLGESGSIYL